MFAFAVGIALGRLQRPAAVLPFGAVVVVIPGVAGHLPGVDLQRQIGELAQQKPVVRNQQQRAGEGFQEPAEPLDCGNIEVVGGFVEHQNVRPRNQYAGQRGTHPPTAGEGAERLYEVRLAKTEVAERLLRFRLQPVGAEMFDLRLEPAVAGEQRIEPVVVLDAFVQLLLESEQPLVHGAELRNRIGGEFHQRALDLILRQMLTQDAEPEILRQ